MISLTAFRADLGIQHSIVYKMAEFGEPEQKSLISSGGLAKTF